MTTSVLSSTTRAAPPRRPSSPNGVGYIPIVAFGVDLYYVDNWSMLQDLSILARTFGAVVGSRGAY